MKALKTYGIIQDDWTVYESEICGIVCALDYPHQTPLAGRINELTQSYFNQWHFVIRTYEKIYDLLHELNGTQDKAKVGAIISEYDLHSIEKEKEFRDYAYLLIISMKTFLDLFASLIEISVTKAVDAEHTMTDFNQIRRFLKKQNLQHLADLIDKYWTYNWIVLLTDMRNKLVHRGYSIKPNFGFTKNEEVNYTIYKGTDMYTNVIKLQIGQFFNSFMYDFPKMEREVSELLKRFNQPSEFSLQVSYRYSGWITEYNVKEITF
ncbi:MAG: hypothetical protein JST70_17425 [Bacteroidetes bacterium]|nr:hypothetical protein [Bacteroidota bacterium]